MEESLKTNELSNVYVDILVVSLEDKGTLSFLCHKKTCLWDFKNNASGLRDSYQLIKHTWKFE